MAIDTERQEKDNEQTLGTNSVNSSVEKDNKTYSSLEGQQNQTDKMDLETQVNTETVAEKDALKNTLYEEIQSTQEIDENVENFQANEIIETFHKLSKEIKEDANGNVVITQEQLNDFDKIDGFRHPKIKIKMNIPAEYNTVITRDDLLDLDSIKATRERLKKETKLEEKRKKELDKLLKEYEKLVNVKNSNNYLLNKGGALGQINRALDQGIYINTPIAFLDENPLIVNLYNNRDKIKNNEKITLNNNGKQVECYNQALFQQRVDNSAEYINSCGYANIAEKYITENTKMSHAQARNAVNTLTTIGILGAGFMALRWLFTKKGANGEREFDFSFSRLATIIGLPMLANYTSQATTGKGLLDNMNHIRRTGEMPWSSTEIEKRSTKEQLALKQNMLNFALLGVPYSVLANCCSPQTGQITGIDTGKLHTYYSSEIEKAKANNDRKHLQILETQQQAVESIMENEKSKESLDNEISKLNLNAEDLSNPNYAQNTLNDKLAARSNSFQKFESYCTTNNLKINENKKSELEYALFTGNETPSEKDFKEMREKGLLIPNDKVYESLQKLNISEEEKNKVYLAYQGLGKNENLSNVSLDIQDQDTIVLKANNQEITLNIRNKAIDGFVDATNNLISFKNYKELLSTGALLCRTAEKIKNKAVRYEGDATTFLGKIKDRMLGSSPNEGNNRPFYIDTTGSIAFNGIEQETIISDMLPIFSDMNRNYPTINNNKQFFVNYLNTHQKVRLNAK